MNQPGNPDPLHFNNTLHTEVLEILPFPVYYRDIDGKFLFCNHAFHRFLLSKNGNISGKIFTDLLSVEQAEVLSRRDKEIVETGHDQHFETTLQFANNEVHEVIIHKIALSDPAGKTQGIVGTIIDISERKKIEEKLHHAEEEKKISATLLQKIRAGIVIVDHELKIIDSNLVFARMFGEENEELFETIPGLKGAELDMLVPETISKMFKAIIETGESRLERDIKYQNKLLSIGIMTIHKHKIVGAIIRDMSAPMLERAEIIERARQVNRKNMKTVQQIAYLLGENAAQTEELLNSIIESQKYEVDENE